jgi:8-oxo-dGTP pyrophosphatase MutT (NUDIX family)
MSSPIAEARPAATLILLRDSHAGPQVLMVRRAATIAFYGGAWAFPGGRVDPGDCAEGESLECIDAVKRAAVREAQEEVALTIAPDQLTWMSLWTTPIVRPKRFKTWFFLSALDTDEVHVDGGEIDAHQWLTFEQAFAAHRAQQKELPPPTFVTLTELSRFTRAEDAIAEFKQRPPLQYTPKQVSIEDGICSLYEGDAGYADEDITRPGPRDRLWSRAQGWHYERS